MNKVHYGQTSRSPRTEPEMPKRNDSPAVQSLSNERQEQQQQATENELERGLEDTFPASDPVSATHTAVLPKHASSEASERGSARHHVDAFEDRLPITSDRRATTGDRVGDKGAAKTEVRALYRAARQVSRTDPAPTARDASVPLPDGAGLLSEFKHRIRERPIATIVAAAVIGFACGMTR